MGIEVKDVPKAGSARGGIKIERKPPNQTTKKTAHLSAKLVKNRHKTIHLTTKVVKKRKNNQKGYPDTVGTPQFCICSHPDPSGLLFDSSIPTPASFRAERSGVEVEAVGPPLEGRALAGICSNYPPSRGPFRYKTYQPSPTFYAKQTQFPKGQNQRNLPRNKKLHQYPAPPRHRKQTQTKPNKLADLSRGDAPVLQVRRGVAGQFKPNFLPDSPSVYAIRDIQYYIRHTTYACPEGGIYPLHLVSAPMLPVFRASYPLPTIGAKRTDPTSQTKQGQNFQSPRTQHLSSSSKSPTPPQQVQAIPFP